MLDHYYTPRDNQDSFPALPFPRHLDALPGTATTTMSMLDVDLAAKPRHPAQHATVVELSVLALEQLVAFDCDSGSESGSDDGYVSTLLRVQRAPPVPSPPRKIYFAPVTMSRKGRGIWLLVQFGPEL
ncbi:hypothetical protein DFH06DRAFT_1332951 [Mycena polygramma]|nr:hypothetical protein DFH06DRAFT_1332951 [Mycena polygramma]